jgi:hypothetical protein
VRVRPSPRMASKLSPGRIRRPPGATLSINFVAAGHQPAFPIICLRRQGFQVGHKAQRSGAPWPPHSLRCSPPTPSGPKVPQLRDFAPLLRMGRYVNRHGSRTGAGKRRGNVCALETQTGRRGFSLSLSFSFSSQDEVGVVKKSIRWVVDRSSLSGRLFSLFVEG